MWNLVAISIGIVSLAFSTTALADGGVPPEAGPAASVQADEPKNSINLGLFTANYERLVGGAHGLIGELNFAGLIFKEGSWGGDVGYRWHWFSRQDSWFVGVNVGYDRGTEQGKLTEDAPASYDYKYQLISVVPNIGKRWTWGSGWNVTFRIGTGYGLYNFAHNSSDPAVMEQSKKAQDQQLPIAFDGELTIGYMM